MQPFISTVFALNTRLSVAVVVLAALLTGQSTQAAATVSQKGSLLIIDGTRADDSVIVIGVDGHPGVVTVKVDGQPMVAHFGLTDIDVDLKGGDNLLAVVQVHLAGDLTIDAGNGENFMVLGYEHYIPNLIWGDLLVSCGHGYNEVFLQESWIIGNTEIELGDGGNDVVLGRADSPSDLGAVIFGDLTIETGTGDDLVEVVKSWFGSQVLIDTWDGSDTVILGTHYETGSTIAGNVFNGDLVVTAGNGSDGVGLTDNEVYGETTIEMGHDNDELLLGAGAGFPPNSFFDQFAAHGGNGQDTLDNDPGNFYLVAPQFQSFELP